MADHSSTSEVYSTAILDQAPRILSLMDRELLSPTAGCCDRTYWAWKFVDFPGARFQESLCVLCFLYTKKLNNNPYYQNARLLEWISYGFQFWSSIQYRDGSFDEAYPFERSLAATAFTTFYIGEALEFIGNSLAEDILSEVLETMVRSGNWLIKNDETHGFLSNHLAAAAGALYHVYRLTGDEAFEQRSKYFIEKIISRQSSEGWYEEYGGADPGYQTHGSFYLARYWQLSRNEDLLNSLERSINFLAYFVHPDGSIGGEYASRNTQTYYPAAFEMLAAQNSHAAWIAESMRPSVRSSSAAGLKCVDIYNYFPFLNNLVFAYLACSNNDTDKINPEEPPDQDNFLWFPEAGIARIRKKYYDAYIGTAKGGVIKAFDRSLKKMIYSDCGYIGKLINGKLFSSQQQGSSKVLKISSDQIELKGRFCELSRPTMKPHTFMAFRLFILSIGRIASLAKWLKQYLVKVLIYRKRELNLYFNRTIEFDDVCIKVSDNISGSDGRRVDKLYWGKVFSTIHMGSSRYFIKNELNEMIMSKEDKANEIDPKQISSGIKLQRKVEFSNVYNNSS